VVGRCLLLLIVSAAGLGTACGPEAPCDRYPGGHFDLSRMRISAPSHPPVGSAEPCLSCHVPRTIHRANCTGVPYIDLAEVRRQVEAGGDSACGRCHGPWDPGP